MSGIAGSAPLAIGGVSRSVSPSPPFRGVQNKLTSLISDCWNADQRGKAVGIYSLAPLLGPVMGPIAGVVIQLLGLAFLPETHKLTLLKRRAKTLSKESDGLSYHMEFNSDQSLVSTLKTALVRPCLLLTTQPVVQVIALYMAYLFGLLYLNLPTFPGVWESVYGESVGIAGLNYTSLGVGFVLGAQVNARMSDRIYHRLKMKRDNTGAPGFRILACSSDPCLSRLDYSDMAGVCRRAFTGSCRISGFPSFLSARSSVCGACRHI